MCTLMPITIDKLTLKAGQKTLLNDISLNITTSGISVIMGPNGAGKSLFVRCLHGLSQPDYKVSDIAFQKIHSFRVPIPARIAMDLARSLGL